jgi:hypothetical protein
MSLTKRPTKFIPEPTELIPGVDVEVEEISQEFMSEIIDNILKQQGVIPNEKDYADA